MNGDDHTNEAVRAIRALARDAYEDKSKQDQLFAIVNDRSADVIVRRAALQALRQLAFSSVVLGDRNVELIATLRGLIDEPDQELRETAISMLAQRKDELVQRRLLDGLERREEPLVEDRKAIVLLGYDIHAGWLPTMRRLAAESPDPAVRVEAIKLLAADPESADLLFSIFDDKSTDDDVRRASGSALMHVARDRFEQRAKEAVLDDSETEPVRASSLTALANLGDPEGVAGDGDFLAQVANVVPSAPDTEAFAVRAAHIGGGEGDLEKALRMFKKRYGLS